MLALSPSSRAHGANEAPLELCDPAAVQAPELERLLSARRESHGVANLTWRLLPLLIARTNARLCLWALGVLVRVVGQDLVLLGLNA